MTTHSYTTSDSAAPDIRGLIDYLKVKDSENFVYRGQTYERAGPLIPSVFRNICNHNLLFTPDSKEYNYCLRHIGKKFYQTRITNSLEALFLSFSGQKSIQDSTEVRILHDLSRNPTVTDWLAKKDFQSVMQISLKPSIHAKYKSRFHIWEQFITKYHQSLLRLNAFNEFLGFPLGMAIAQQYIVNSEYLDVTRSLRVAAFFAMHESPTYNLLNKSRVSNRSSKIGIIYRFNVKKFKDKSPLDYNFYNAPPFMDCIKLLKRLELHEDDSNWNPKDFVVNFHLSGGQRYWELINLKQGSVEESRIGRQQACFLIPDLLYSETKDQRGRQIISFRAVEDLATRNGTEKYYFQHSDKWLENVDLTPEKLWPAKGVGELLLIELVRNIILSKQILRQEARKRGKTLIEYDDPELWIPSRPDLINPGYISYT